MPQQDYKMNKKTFTNILNKYGNSSINSETAWEIYLRCIKTFKNSDKDNIEYLKKIGSMNMREKLILLRMQICIVLNVPI